MATLLFFVLNLKHCFNNLLKILCYLNVFAEKLLFALEEFRLSPNFDWEKSMIMMVVGNVMLTYDLTTVVKT